MKTEKNYHLKKLLTVCMGLFVLGNGWAGTINDWNLDNITIDPGPFVVGENYQSTIFTDSSKTASNGAISWDEDNVMAPGLSVVNDDDADSGRNCVMTAGVNPEDLTIKQCSDPFKSSKRIKIKTTSTGTALDLVFDANNTGGLLEPYRIFEKYLNVTGNIISDFKIELGFGTDIAFMPAAADIGLDFSDAEGVPWVGEIITGDTPPLNLDALFPFGLFGDAETNQNHDEDGYFDPTDRGRFYLQANRGTIQSTGISPNYRNFFGDFLAKSQVLSGYFYDHDGDDETDALMMAHLTDIGWVSFRPDQWWIDLSLPVPGSNLDGTLTESTILNWEASADDYNIGPIEDLANLNLNYHIALGDISLWPTYDLNSDTAQFTLRISSISVIFANGFD
jgi:hypothetical protein